MEKQTNRVEVTDKFESPLFAKLGVEESNLGWENIALRIRGQEILKGVSGYVDAGSVTAILGPSGAGKSTLLNILAGRILNKGSKRLSGRVTVNGELINPSKYRKKIAYVMQHDSLFATATCREALMFSASLRLPGSVTHQEKIYIVTQLLDWLGLEGCADTMIGSELVRGVSGGEKKRVALGVELVTNPSTMFLDEPTSGLDSFNAFNTVKIMKGLATNGCSVLATVHQPSSEIFNLFDNVILLKEGTCIYHGSVKELPTKFSEAGFTVPPLTNPADYVMMLMQIKDLDELPVHAVDVVNEKSDDLWTLKYAKVRFERPTTVWTQATLLMKREFLNLGRDKGALIGMFAVATTLNLLFAAIFFQVGDVAKPGYDINSHFGALFNLYISAFSSAVQPPLLTFPLERVVFLREYSTGSYGAFPYFLSKLLVEVPLNGLQALVALLISYYLMGFVGDFLLHVCSLWLIQLVCASYAFLIGALVPDAKAAQEIAPAILVPQLLFAGFFISIEQIPELLQWVQYLCALKFAINLGSIIEFGDLCGQKNLTADISIGCDVRIFEANDVDPGQTWVYVLILTMIFAVFRSLALAALPLPLYFSFTDGGQSRRMPYELELAPLTSKETRMLKDIPQNCA